MLVLLAASIMSSLPYNLIAVVLLLIMLLITIRPRQARYNAVLTLAIVFLGPLVLAPLLEQLLAIPAAMVSVMAAVSILPVIYLFDYHLRQYAPHIQPSEMDRRQGRHPTDTFKTLVVLTLIILFISFILDNPALLFTGILFALYLLGVLSRVLLAIPRQPLEIPITGKRVIAGSTIDISVPVRSKSSLRLYSRLVPGDSWVKVSPREFILDNSNVGLNMTITPPLAGPSRPRFHASVIDPWGFIQTNQLLEPVELHVIPRADYAEWLAARYLEQTAMGVSAATIPPSNIVTIPKRGIEYYSSRSYQPGDPLRDIDWKHSSKLGQLVVKEYITASEQQAAIIAVNLSVTGAEEADKLAFNLITTALTFAYESIPTALAAYNHQEVILTTTVTNPREILKKALSLVKDITSVDLAQRYLQPPDIGKLRRNISQLKQIESEPARRLTDILNFEYRSIQESARSHPATVALLLVTRHAPVPAMIAMVSQLNHDAEALLVTTEKLSRREFTSIYVNATG